MDKNSIVCVLSSAYMQYRMTTEKPLSPEEFYEKYHEDYERALEVFSTFISEKA